MHSIPFGGQIQYITSGYTVLPVRPSTLPYEDEWPKTGRGLTGCVIQDAI